METTKTISGLITNTISMRAIVLMVLFSLSFISYGQQLKMGEQFSFENRVTAEYELTSFKCKNVEGAVYIIWSVLESSDDCVYILERSYNNKNYEQIYSVQSAKSPNNNELLNSYEDKKPLDGTSYYRVKRFSKGSEIASRGYVVNGIHIESDYISTSQNNEGFADAEFPKTSF
jgi:hypothetical protein